MNVSCEHMRGIIICLSRTCKAVSVRPGLVWEDSIRCVVVVRHPVSLRAAAEIKQCHLAVSSQLHSVLAQITSTREIWQRSCTKNCLVWVFSADSSWHCLTHQSGLSHMCESGPTGADWSYMFVRNKLSVSEAGSGSRTELCKSESELLFSVTVSTESAAAVIGECF